MSGTYTIGALSGITGLSPHTIRAWERRYGALTPNRSGTNRRLYGAEDVERLQLLRRVVESGHSIGQVAHLPMERLRGLPATPTADRSQTSAGRKPGDAGLEACRAAVANLDAQALEVALVRGGAEVGVPRLVESVVLPLLADIEAGWVEGRVSIAQEHLASAVLRTYLDRVRISTPGSPHWPRLLVTTPRDQVHELGALLAAVLAGLNGWNVTYLGPNLPAREIVVSAQACGARAIALSVVYPTTDDGLEAELKKIREGVGDAIPILVGGRGAVSYSEALRASGARLCTTFADLVEALDGIALA